MNIFILFCLIYSLIHNCNGFIIKTSYSKSLSIQRRNMLNNDYVDLIHKYKSFFYKENVIDLINEINSDKISEMFISKDYTELVGVDKFISSNINDKFHLTQVSPVEIQYILKKFFLS